MSEKEEKSAIDLIYKMFNTINKVNEKVDLLSASMTDLNNKLYMANKEIKVIRNQLNAKESVTAVKKPVKYSASSVEEPKKSDKFTIGNVKMFGYVYTKSRDPIQNVRVRVITSENYLVRELDTDKDGYWEVRLRSGDYTVEYKHGRFTPFNKFVSVPDGAKEIEVK